MSFDRVEDSGRDVAWRYGDVPLALALRGRRSDAGPRDPERLDEIRELRRAGQTWDAIAGAVRRDAAGGDQATSTHRSGARSA